MNSVLWVVAGVLAAVFLAAGAMKLTQPRAKLAAVVVVGRFGPESFTS